MENGSTAVTNTHNIALLPLSFPHADKCSFVVLSPKILGVGELASDTVLCSQRNTCGAGEGRYQLLLHQDELARMATTISGITKKKEI